jgi:uncharacterized membrane protein
MEAFSDAVFAIAATLLILEINIPVSDFDHLWRAIGDQWPSYLAYVTSFMSIGGVWLGHHAIVRRLASADLGVMRLNLVLLLVIAFLPFPTKLAAEALTTTTDAERAAVIFYGVVLLVMSLSIDALWRYIAARPRLLADWVTSEDVKAVTRNARPNIGFHIVFIALAVVLPLAAATGYALVAIRSVVRAPGAGAMVKPGPGPAPQR